MNISEEENKAIEVIETVIRANRFDGLYTSVDAIIEAMQTILKLTDRQQKEIKALEQINSNYEVIAKEQRKEIEKLKKEVKTLGEELGYE